MAQELYFEDCDGDDVILTPIENIKCCGEWIGGIQVYEPLVKVEKTLPLSNTVIVYWQCPTCKGCY